ncbi:hypothetical protein ES703_50480 [subsurface metagenome]
MLNQYEVAEDMRNLGVPDDIQDLVNGILCGIAALAARASNSNSCQVLNTTPTEQESQCIKMSNPNSTSYLDTDLLQYLLLSCSVGVVLST